MLEWQFVYLFICLFILPPVLHSRTMILASAPLFAQISVI